MKKYSFVLFLLFIPFITADQITDYYGFSFRDDCTSYIGCQTLQGHWNVTGNLTIEQNVIIETGNLIVQGQGTTGEMFTVGTDILITDDGTVGKDLTVGRDIELVRDFKMTTSKLNETLLNLSGDIFLDGNICNDTTCFTLAELNFSNINYTDFIVTNLSITDCINFSDNATYCGNEINTTSTLNINGNVTIETPLGNTFEFVDVLFGSSYYSMLTGGNIIFMDKGLFLHATWMGDEAWLVFTKENDDSENWKFVYDSGDGSFVLNEVGGVNELFTIEENLQVDRDLNASNGLYVENINPNAVNDLSLFGINDVGDSDDGKSFIVNRKASEGDNNIEMYIDQYELPYIQSTGTIGFQPRNGLDISLGEYSDSGENPSFLHAGYITSTSNEVWVEWKVDDTDDLFTLTPENSYIDGFEINMDTYVTESLFVTNNVTANNLCYANGTNCENALSPHISISTKSLSTALGTKRSPFDKDSYTTYLYEENSASEIVYDEVTGKFFINSTGVYEIEFVGNLRITSSDEVNITLLVDDLPIYSEFTFIHSSVDPVTRVVSIQKTLNRYSNVTVLISSLDGIDSVQFYKGTTINLNRLMAGSAETDTRTSFTYCHNSGKTSSSTYFKILGDSATCTSSICFEMPKNGYLTTLTAQMYNSIVGIGTWTIYLKLNGVNTDHDVDFSWMTTGILSAYSKSTEETYFSAGDSVSCYASESGGGLTLDGGCCFGGYFVN